MDLSTLLLAAAAGTASLAVGATAWSLRARRGGEPSGDVGHPETATRRSLEAAAEAFEIALVSLSETAGDDGAASGFAARLVAGAESLAFCAERLGAADGGAEAIVAKLAALDPAHGAQLQALVASGAPCAFEA
ncbi:MAG TPA: hypothetical protein VHS81_13440, partial [Caulobacteraceae bacterium]|nr:hypothetical protein [Caulobacteraceae bacterium]